MGRASGVLLAVSSLPNSYGIGTFGKEAYDFIDFLVRTKQGIGRSYLLLPQVMVTLLISLFLLQREVLTI